MSEEIILNRREGVVAAQDIHLNRSVYSEPYPVDVYEKYLITGAVTIKGVIRPHPLIDGLASKAKHILYASGKGELVEVFAQLEIVGQATQCAHSLHVSGEVSLEEVYQQLEIEKVETKASHKLSISGTWNLYETVKQVSITQEDTLIKGKGVINGTIKTNS